MQKMPKKMFILSVGMYVSTLLYLGLLYLMEGYAYGKSLIGQHKLIWANPNEALGETGSSPV